MKFDDTSRLFPWLKLVGNEWVDTRQNYVLSTIKRLCRDCRKVYVNRNQLYCGKCSAARKREANRVSQRKRRSDVRKVGFSPIRAEALTSAEM